MTGIMQIEDLNPK